VKDKKKKKSYNPVPSPLEQHTREGKIKKKVSLGWRSGKAVLAITLLECNIDIGNWM